MLLHPDQDGDGSADLSRKPGQGVDSSATASAAGPVGWCVQKRGPGRASRTKVRAMDRRSRGASRRRIPSTDLKTPMASGMASATSSQAAGRQFIAIWTGSSTRAASPSCAKAGKSGQGFGACYPNGFTNGWPKHILRRSRDVHPFHRAAITARPSPMRRKPAKPESAVCGETGLRTVRREGGNNIPTPIASGARHPLSFEDDRD